MTSTPVLASAPASLFLLPHPRWGPPPSTPSKAVSRQWFGARSGRPRQKLALASDMDIFDSGHIHLRACAPAYEYDCCDITPTELRSCISKVGPDGQYTCLVCDTKFGDMEHGWVVHKKGRRHLSRVRDARPTVSADAAATAPLSPGMSALSLPLPPPSQANRSGKEGQKALKDNKGKAYTKAMMNVEQMTHASCAI